MKNYNVTCTYKYEFPGDNIKIDKAIEKAIGFKCSGAGVGFGERDLSFNCGTSKKAVDIFQKLSNVSKKFKLTGISLYLR